MEPGGGSGPASGGGNAPPPASSPGRRAAADRPRCRPAPWSPLRAAQPARREVGDVATRHGDAAPGAAVFPHATPASEPGRGAEGFGGPASVPGAACPPSARGRRAQTPRARLRGRGPAAPGRGGARRRFTVAPRAPVLLRVKHARRLLCESEQLNGLNESDDKDLIAIALPAGLRGAMRRHLGERFTKRGGGSSPSSARKLCTLQGGERASPGPRPRGLALEGAPQP